MTHTKNTNVPMRTRGRLEQAGFTLAEAVIAVAISSVSLGGVMMLNAQQLKTVRSTRQSNAASMVLQDRVEQLRLTAWANLTDTVWLKDHVFDELPSCAQFLPGYTETVTLTPWGEESTDKMEVVNRADGGFTTVSSGSAMSNRRQGRLDIVVTWEGQDKRIRERSFATVISNGGITRVGLMGYGSYSNDGGSSGSGTTPTPDPEPTPTPTPTPTPEPTPTPSNNGNGNGNGNNGNGNSGGTNNGNGKGRGNTGGQGGIG